MDLDTRLKVVLEAFALLTLAQGLIIWILRPHLRIWVRKVTNAKVTEETLAGAVDHIEALQRTFELRGTRIKEMEDQLRQLPSVAESLERVSTAMETLANQHAETSRSVVKIEEGQRWMLKMMEERRSGHDRRQSHE